MTQTTKINRTKEVLAQMITGVAGKLAEVSSAPASKFDLSDSFFCDALVVEHSTFHFLSSCLEVDQNLTRRFRNWERGVASPTQFFIDGFAGYLKKKGLYVTSVGGDEEIPKRGVSTASGPTCLSHEFYALYFEIDRQRYAAIAVLHEDGGNSATWVFKVSYESPSLDEHNKVVVVSRRTGDNEVRPGDRIIWESNDAGGTYAVEDADGHDVIPLNEYGITDDPNLRGRGFIYLDQQANKAYCPVTGRELDCGWEV